MADEKKIKKIEFSIRNDGKLVAISKGLNILESILDPIDTEESLDIYLTNVVEMVKIEIKNRSIREGKEPPLDEEIYHDFEKLKKYIKSFTIYRNI